MSNNNAIVTILFSLMVLSSCATLAPAQDRTASFQIKTSLTKAVAHSKINEWAAKNLGDSNSAIKMNDKEAGKLVMHANVSCAEANPASAYIGKPVDLWFNFTSTSNDNVVGLQFEDIAAEGGFEPSSASETAKLSKACLEPIVRQLEVLLK
jgi:hypothetical protein